MPSPRFHPSRRYLRCRKLRHLRTLPELWPEERPEQGEEAFDVSGPRFRGSDETIPEENYRGFQHYPVGISVDAGQLNVKSPHLHVIDLPQRKVPLGQPMGKEPHRIDSGDGLRKGDICHLLVSHAHII
jgi:hypothetical protein